MEIQMLNVPRQIGKTTWALEMLKYNKHVLVFEPTKMHLRYVQKKAEDESRVVHIDHLECYTPSYPARYLIFDDIPSKCLGIYLEIAATRFPEAIVICLYTSMELEKLQIRMMGLNTYGTKTNSKV